MHPYTKYEQTKLWQVIESGIAELEENKDLEIRTAGHYVIGYLCKKLSGAGPLAKTWLSGSTDERDWFVKKHREKGAKKRTRTSSSRSRRGRS